MPPRRFGSPALLVFLAIKGLLQSRLSAALLVAAVAAGMSFQIPNTGNLAGYEAELLVQGVSSGAGDVRLRPRSTAHFADGDALTRKIAAEPEVRAAVPVLTLPGALGAGGRWLSTPVLGIDAEASRRPYRIVSGTELADGEADGALVGTALAGRLRLAVGQAVELRVILDTAARPDDPPSTPPGKKILGTYKMTVRGIMRGSFTADEVVVVNRRFLIGEAGAPGAASLLLVYSDAPGAAVALARRLEGVYPEAESRAWMEDSRFLDSAIQGNRALNAISSAMAMVGVAIPVWALLYMSVTQRRREIGLYCALGFGSREVFALFLLQALVVGVVGVALGSAVGYGLIRWFVAHPLFKNDSFEIRPVLSTASLLRSLGIILGTTLLAGVYPALRASRTDPAEALRGLG